MKPKIAVCIPHWGSVSLEWAHNIYAPAYLGTDEEFTKTIKTSQGILNLDTERNTLVKYALEDPQVTHILFIDTDCVLEEYNLNDAIRMMLDTKLPIVAGLYRTKMDGYPYAMWYRKNNAYINITDWKGGNLIPVDAIGFGFVLIERKVFESIDEPWFVWNDSKISEDWCMCIKFREYNVPINVLTEIKLAHIGTFKLCTDGKFHTLKI